MAVLLAGGMMGHAVFGGDASQAPVTSFRSLWTLHGDARAQPQPFAIDTAVLHYDPAWRQLWCEDATSTFFLVAPDKPLPIRSGQLVRLKGITVPANTANVLQLSAEVLAPRAEIKPLPAGGRLLRSDLLNERFIELEAYVDRQRLSDPNHLRLSLVADGLQLEAVLLLEPDQVVPAYAGALVRVQGVYNGRFDSANRLQSIELMISGSDRICITGHLASDSRFNRPATPSDLLPRLDQDQLVRISGRVVAVSAGRSITLRDDQGEVELLTPQDCRLALNDWAEGIGFPLANWGRWQLRSALVRSTDAPGDRPHLAGRPLLRLAHEVLALPPATAATAQAVRLEGVVTWSAPGVRFLFLQDATGGVQVSWTDLSIATPPPGTSIAVDGSSTMGPFAPALVAQRMIHRFGIAPPTAAPITLEQAETGVHEAQWVEIEGILRARSEREGFLRLHLSTPTGEFDALAPAGTQFSAPPGSFVRVRGVCTALANDQRQLTGVQLWVPDPASVVLDEAPPEDLFGLPEVPIAKLRQYGPLQRTTRWLHTSGIVTWSQADHSLILQDADEGLLVLVGGPTRFLPGDRVAVVGILGRAGPRTVLRNADTRRIGSGAFIRPIPLDPSAPTEDRLDTRLVRLSGRLDEITSLGEEHFLEIRHSTGAIAARLPAEPNAPLPRDWRAGAEIELTGVYRLIFDEHRRRTRFEILLRTPADLRIVRPAPAWTPARARALVAGLGAAALLVGLWVLVLRRKVRQQTAQIRAQIEKETHLEAELERAQRLQSLGTMAGGIAHDFNNLLTVVMGNITLAMLDRRVMALAGDCLTEAENGAQRARDLTQQILTFARGGEPIRETFALPPLVHDAVALALSGAKVRADVHIPPEVWPVHADRAQIHRALHNLLQHAITAMPGGGVVSIALANESTGDASPPALAPGDYVRIAITDHGDTIAAAQLHSIFDPYAAAALGGERFGLATAYSIAKKHGGILTAHARAEAGTTFSLWLPATRTEPSTTTPASRPAALELPAQADLAGARVLVMDDEEGIRLLAKMLLRHLGCEPVLTADGHSCIDAFRAARGDGQPFDLVILDLTVPGGIGGREVMAELLRIDPQVRAIVSSGYSDDPVLARFREHGFAAAVTKPYEVETLAATIRTVLVGRRRA